MDKNLEDISVAKSSIKMKQTACTSCKFSLHGSTSGVSFYYLTTFYTLNVYS